MTRKPRFSGPSALILVALSLLAALGGCGDDGPTETTDPELEPFVGLWTATSLVQTSTENPDKSLDLVAEGATFTMEIQTNGRYSTVLNVFDNEFEEDGRVEVEGQQLVFFSSTNVTQGDPATWTLSGNDLVLEGSSTFDFPNDEEGSVPTTLLIQLRRS